MKRSEILRMKIDSETEGLGYVLAALIEAQPSNAEELTFFLKKISSEIKDLPNPGPRDIAAREVALSLWRGVDAFQYREGAEDWDGIGQ